jgi:hypothetical protein
MMKTMLKLAAVSLSAIALVAQPAVAAKSNGNATASAKDGGAFVQQKAGTKKYCANTESTGSRILTRVCLTEREWLANGVDILSMRK